MPRQTIDKKLAHARTKITYWERRVRRAANKLAAYRAVETRLIRKQIAEIAAMGKKIATTTRTPRKFDFTQ